MATAAPIWVNVKHDETCKCGRALRGGEDRGQYDMDGQEFVACESCSPDMVETAKPDIEDRLSEPGDVPANILGNLVAAVELFARANGCSGKVDKMLAALMRAAL